MDVKELIKYCKRRQDIFANSGDIHHSIRITINEEYRKLLKKNTCT